MHAQLGLDHGGISGAAHDCVLHDSEGRQFLQCNQKPAQFGVTTLQREFMHERHVTILGLALFICLRQDFHVVPARERGQILYQGNLSTGCLQLFLDLRDMLCGTPGNQRKLCTVAGLRGLPAFLLDLSLSVAVAFQAGHQ